MTTKLPPYLQSEISSRLRTDLGDGWPLAEDLAGEQVESLLCAIWLMGYAHGANDGPDGEIGRYLLDHHT